MDNISEEFEGDGSKDFVQFPDVAKESWGEAHSPY